MNKRILISTMILTIAAISAATSVFSAQNKNTARKTGTANSNAGATQGTRHKTYNSSHSNTAAVPPSSNKRGNSNKSDSINYNSSKSNSGNMTANSNKRANSNKADSINYNASKSNTGNVTANSNKPANSNRGAKPRKKPVAAKTKNSK